jgi:hypothetical protein
MREPPAESECTCPDTVVDHSSFSLDRAWTSTIALDAVCWCANA